MSCYLFGAKSLSEPMLAYCPLDPNDHSFYILFENQQFMVVSDM